MRPAEEAMEKEARNLFGMGQTTLGTANRPTVSRRSSMVVLFVLGKVPFDGCHKNNFVGDREQIANLGGQLLSVQSEEIPNEPSRQHLTWSFRIMRQNLAAFNRR